MAATTDGTESDGTLGSYDGQRPTGRDLQCRVRTRAEMTRIDLELLLQRLSSGQAADGYFLVALALTAVGLPLLGAWAALGPRRSVMRGLYSRALSSSKNMAQPFKYL